MTDHKFTEEEVIKALKCCREKDCGDCPLCEYPQSICEWDALDYALDLINRQKAEISALTSAVDNSTQEFLKLHDTYQEQKEEIAMKNAEINAYSIAKKFDAEYFNADIKKLEKENAELRMENHILATEYAERVRAEAIKEFADRLKERAYTSSDWSHGEHPQVVECDDIDDLVEEMTEVEKQ